MLLSLQDEKHFCLDESSARFERGSWHQCFERDTADFGQWQLGQIRAISVCTRELFVAEYF